MFHQKVEQYPLWAWTAAALSAPTAMLAGSGEWLGVLALGIACGGICWGIHVLTEETPEMPAWYCAAQFLFLILAVGVFTGMTAECWPTGNSFPTVPLTLLILAAFSAMDGANRASRVGGVLFWFLALLYAVILASEAKDIKAPWLIPGAKAPDILLVCVFLIPAVTSFFPKEKGKACCVALVSISVFGALIAFWTAGVLSPAVAAAAENPFYEFSKSLSLFGTAGRLEAFAGVALTLGFFSLLSLLLSAAGYLSERFHPGWGRMGVLICTAAGALLMLDYRNVFGVWLAGLSFLFWGLLPLLVQGAATIKKSKKP